MKINHVDIHLIEQWAIFYCQTPLEVVHAICTADIAQIAECYAVRASRYNPKPALNLESVLIAFNSKQIMRSVSLCYSWLHGIGRIIDKWEVVPPTFPNTRVTIADEIAVRGRRDVEVTFGRALELYA